MTEVEERRHAGARAAAEIACIGAGVALLAGAWLADAGWFDQHFFPDMFTHRPKQMALLAAGRIFAALLGVALLAVVRPYAARLLSRVGAGRAAIGAAPIVLAILMAVGVSELVMRTAPFRAAQEAPAGWEPLRRRDPVLGWVFVPNHSALGRVVGGRRVLYAFDAGGRRVRRSGDQVDPARPAVLFVGESIILGHGLSYDESLPGQVERRLGVQSADLAVEAYAIDQGFARLRLEMPKFRRPVAVVSLFMPGLMARVLDDDRPHLDAGLVTRPETPHWRLATMAKRLVPYRSRREMDRGVAMTRRIFLATDQLARAHGAVSLLLVPQLGPETPAERALRHRVLDGSGLAYVVVPLDPAWRIPGNKHPDARGAQAMAAAVAERLGDAARRAGASPRSLENL